MAGRGWQGLRAVYEVEEENDFSFKWLFMFTALLLFMFTDLLFHCFSGGIGDSGEERNPQGSSEGLMIGGSLQLQDLYSGATTVQPKDNNHITLYYELERLRATKYFLLRSVSCYEFQLN